MHELEILFFFFLHFKPAAAVLVVLKSLPHTHTHTRTACYLYISSALVLVEKQLYSCVTFIDAIHFLIATCCTMLSCRSFHFCNWNAWMWNMEFLWEKRDFQLCSLFCVRIYSREIAKKADKRSHIYECSKPHFIAIHGSHRVLWLWIPFNWYFLWHIFRGCLDEILTKSHKQLSILRFFFLFSSSSFRKMHKNTHMQTLAAPHKVVYYLTFMMKFTIKRCILLER